MTPLEITAILTLTAWAIYRQTIVSEVTFTTARFKMAAVYAVVGLAVGGFDTPSGWKGWLMIILGLALSFVVGLIRGRCTKLWVADGKVWRRGTVLTIALFIGLIAAKFALGTVAYFWHVDDGAGFGEVLVMIAIMIGVQAQIIYARGRAVQPSPSASPEPLAHAAR